MSEFIDRRKNGKHKSTVNRQRFIRRYKEQIKEAVADAHQRREMTDRGDVEVGIPRRGIDEPVFQHGKGGARDMVHPGNKEFGVGDRVQRPEQGASGGGASDHGEGEDDFTFTLTREEFLELLFDGLELPRMVRNQFVDDVDTTAHRAGFRRMGNPSQIEVRRTMREAYARRIVLGNPKRKRIKEIEALLETETDPAVQKVLQDELEALKRALGAIPYIETFDVRYQGFEQRPNPSSRAVMVCIMDVSGSMHQERKDLAKRFFILMHLFLERNYEHIELVFIRHTHIAEEVSEQEFFYSRESGGTKVSTALTLAHDIVQARYPPETWNVYMAHCSDGDDWDNDALLCKQFLEEVLLPYVRYYAYVEVQPGPQRSLWMALGNIREENIAMQEVESPDDIYPVVRKLFASTPAYT